MPQFAAEVTVGQLLVALPTILAAVTGYLAFKASKKRDAQTLNQADRKVALDEFNAINAMKQKIVEDLRLDIISLEKEVTDGLAREAVKDEAMRKLRMDCDNEKYSYQNQVFNLQRQIEQLQRGKP